MGRHAATREAGTSGVDLSPAFAHEFDLDRFQVEAMAAIDGGANVLVAAPTGAGKTVVAEHAVQRALDGDRRCFYTAPIKALSNQKFADLGAVLGIERVGLLTGDHAINPEADVVVMTTEVLRNMIYGRSGHLERLGWVVLDEVHFLQDPYRGPVWEEVLIHTPAGVGFVCLSATVSNADELGSWIEALRGPTVTVVETERPIRLDPLMMVGDRSAEREHLVPLLVKGRANPEGRRFDADRPLRHEGRGRHQRSRFFTPRRVETVDRLDDEALLPAIYFIFSRAGCDTAARQYLEAGRRLTSSDERSRIREIADRRTRRLRDEDLDVLDHDQWIATLEHGVAAHHAGMIPSFREAVEDCFNEGLLKVVFATETLALGINMPARSVVIERLSKFNGESHEFLTPGQFTQLSGRAGRRGLDSSGAAVVLWSPFAPFDQVAGLAASRSFPLASSFRPTYNMTANLVLRYDHDAATEVLGRSFAQYQADRAVVRLLARRARLSEELDALRRDGGALDEQVFDLAGYAELHRQLRAARRHGRGDRSGLEAALQQLRPGDVVRRPGRGRGQLLVVLAVSTRRGGAIRVRATGTNANLVNLDVSNCGGILRPLTRLRLPAPHRAQDPAYRRSAAKLLRRVDTRELPEAEFGVDAQDPVAPARDALESHPLHHHPDREQLLAGHRGVARLEDELEALDREADRRGSGLVAQFDAVVRVLELTGHVEQWELTSAGQRLRRVYHECDLLVSLALERGLFDGLEPAATAALASCVTFERRSADEPPGPDLPDPELRIRVAALEGLSEELGRIERRARAPLTRAPQSDFAPAAWAWASGQELEHILDDDMTGGDFVRNVRQLVDLLRQIEQLAGSDQTRASARQASDALVRGVVGAAGGPS